MLYKALISFSGVVSMAVDEIREIPDPSIVQDLLKAGYIEAVEEKTENPEKQAKQTKRKIAK